MAGPCGPLPGPANTRGMSTQTFDESQHPRETGGKFAAKPVSEVPGGLDALGSGPELAPDIDIAELELYAIQDRREAAQERWRAAVANGDAAERVAADAEVQELSLAVLTRQIARDYPGATHLVLGEDDQESSGMVVTDVLDAGGKTLETGEFGVDDAFTAASDLQPWSPVWLAHSADCDPAWFGPQWKLDMAAARAAEVA